MVLYSISCFIRCELNFLLRKEAWRRMIEKLKNYFLYWRKLSRGVQYRAP
jgi:hypothetical protein